MGFSRSEGVAELLDENWCLSSRMDRSDDG